jgi:hypothetical protein
MSKNITQTLGRMLAKAARYGPAQAWMQGLSAAYKQSQIQQTTSPGFDIPEVLPITARTAAIQDGPRINLLVPAISQKHVFGGIATALQVFDSVRQHFASARIILTDETDPEPSNTAYYSHWPCIPLSQECPTENHIVPAGARWEQTLPVHAQDYFMATAWWTAHNAQALLSWQLHQFPQIPHRRLLYLIQDFEPGFYPWSSRYVLAQATYNQPDRTIAVINSHWLKDYLQQQGHQFSSQHVLTPHLHPALAAARKRQLTFKKDRQLLIYGRPGTERNAFSVIVAALRLWAKRYVHAVEWKILSAGEPFATVDLGQNTQLCSLGKLTIDDYANLLSRTAIGMSLMISPHPSYPPLEMAAFGARVITNSFANKNLSAISSFLVSVDQPDPEKLADTLLALTTGFDKLNPDSRSVDQNQIDWHDDFLQPGDNVWSWTSQVASELLMNDDHKVIAT